MHNSVLTRPMCNDRSSPGPVELLIRGFSSSQAFSLSRYREQEKIDSLCSVEMEGYGSGKDDDEQKQKAAYEELVQKAGSFSRGQLDAWKQNCWAD